MNNNEHLEAIRAMRVDIGTKPRELEERLTQYHRGGEAVSVRLVIPNRPVNYYAGMFVMAVSTWGGPYDSGVDKWNKAKVESRIAAVRAVLQRQALPLALEHPQFLFEVTGCSRSAFDQIARMRIGTTFSSMGTRDNAHGDFEVVVPPHIYDDLMMLRGFKQSIEASKHAYVDLLKAGRSWQDARAVLPQSMVHRFCMNINYAALSGFMAKRLMFEEQFDTVAVAWKMRQELARYYAVLAAPLRPACDLARRCVYHQTNSLSEAFGCLFKGCERWGKPDYKYADFDEYSTEESDVEAWLGEKIPAPTDPIPWDEAFEKDRFYFEQTL